MSWTDERVAKLTKMWAEGKSASDIAKELGKVTRNAVIGKVHRLGLKGRATPSKEPVDAPEVTITAPKNEKKAAPATAQVVEKETKTTAAPKIQASEMELEDFTESAIEQATQDEIAPEAREQAARVEQESKRLSLMQLTERVCKWPIGDPATEDFWFCGHPSQPGKPYCDAHVELAFQAPMSRRDRRS